MNKRHLGLRHASELGLGGSYMTPRASLCNEQGLGDHKVMQWFKRYLGPHHASKQGLSDHRMMPQASQC